MTIATRVLRAVGLAMALTLPLSAAGAPRLTVARLQYDGGGDWSANPSSIPTLLAATAYKLWEARGTLDLQQIGPLALSSVTAFASALLSIRFLLRFVSRHSFAVFAWYRIIFGGVVLAAWALGWASW